MRTVQLQRAFGFFQGVSIDGCPDVRTLANLVDKGEVAHERIVVFMDGGDSISIG